MTREALVDALVARVANEGHAPTVRDVTSLLRAGCTREQIRERLRARLGPTHDAIAIVEGIADQSSPQPPST